jgi:hypothetical protein
MPPNHKSKQLFDGKKTINTKIRPMHLNIEILNELDCPKIAK